VACSSKGEVSGAPDTWRVGFGGEGKKGGFAKRARGKVRGRAIKLRKASRRKLR